MKKVKRVPKTKAKTTETKSKDTMANFMDGVILKGGTWEEMIEVCKVEAKKRNNKVAMTGGALNGHIKYRLERDKKYLGSLKVTEKGIF